MGDNDVASTAVVEVLLLRARGGAVAYRRAVGPVGVGEHPDEAAGRLAVTTDQPRRRVGGPPLALLHSTSWRYVDGVLLLTYVGLPDPLPWLPARRLDHPRIVMSTDPTRPSPPDVQIGHVVAHGCRHLAWLTATDPQVAQTLADQPDLRAVIDRCVPAPAGALVPAG